jgi:hypothetical protein
MDILFLLQELRSLNPPTDELVVVSSGALAIRGIREAKDLDVIVTVRLWNEITKKHPRTLNDWGIERVLVDNNIEILNPAQSIFGNSKVIPAHEIFDQSDIFNGVRFINLEHLRTIKSKLGRKIDHQDVELINAFLKQEQRANPPQAARQQLAAVFYSPIQVLKCVNKLLKNQPATINDVSW